MKLRTVSRLGRAARPFPERMVIVPHSAMSYRRLVCPCAFVACSCSEKKYMLHVKAKGGKRSETRCPREGIFSTERFDNSKSSGIKSFFTSKCILNIFKICWNSENHDNYKSGCLKKKRSPIEGEKFIKRQKDRITYETNRYCS